MRKWTLALSAAALALGGTGIAAFAQGKQSPDTNSDGVVSLEETRAQATSRFERMDANQDGQLDKADREAIRARRFATVDADGDGEVTQAEMTAAREARGAERAERRAERQAARFEQLDIDGSCALSEAEMAAARDARGEARTERGGKRQYRRGGERMGRGMEMLRLADANQDQIVTRAEFDAAVEARFARLDTDGSGTISAEERKAAHGQMRGDRAR